MNDFGQRLSDAILAKKTPAMVGIDPRWELLPEELRRDAVAEHGETTKAVAQGYQVFCQRVLDEVADLVPVVKFQMAFFEAAGAEGLLVLSQLVDHAHDAGLLVVLDGKRNDIGSTAAAYANAYVGSIGIGSTTLRPWNADALTVSPYLGTEGINPFVESCDKHGTGIFVLVRTSNPGAGAIQELSAEGRSVCERVADLVEGASASLTSTPDGYGPLGAVVGATVPEQLVALRKRMPHVPLLIPGYGAQGGSAADTSAGFDERGLGAVVNSSRAILFSYRLKDGAEAPWKDSFATAARRMIDDLATHTPAGRLR
ncbi:Orotidine 5'-phosphate decarboxylase [Planctomycetes bacterium Pan216]|uniref:Orotidine 5'-phosphate decarboxylase n=1 Tax=Kolteria novifilia TaxID=2527975 RepID=A0A518B0L1_9BACT|nr:Orotidine 5'-phosphate decarboxylase [Planctomycetes bacterium Pan216]